MSADMTGSKVQALSVHVGNRSLFSVAPSTGPHLFSGKGSQRGRVLSHFRGSSKELGTVNCLGPGPRASLRKVA